MYTKLIEILKGVINIVLIITHNDVLNEKRREKRRRNGREKIKKKERSRNVSHKTKCFKILIFICDVYAMDENIF